MYNSQHKKSIIFQLFKKTKKPCWCQSSCEGNSARILNQLRRNPSQCSKCFHGDWIMENQLDRGCLAFGQHNNNPQSFRRARICNFLQLCKNGYKSMMTFIESAPKAGLLSLKALRKQDDFNWKLYESRMTFVESTTKALQKPDDFCWKLCESRIRMTFVESSNKAF